ncbi:unnamed protein product [Rodentolepis nana]|uniref:Ovule protein n=1 Tax=Rodentolepis nana TaxID=102285 RepID=A0A0R3T5C5_RODNA|nr:unnamed protein product [Rodentolepis nana]
MASCSRYDLEGVDFHLTNLNHLEYYDANIYANCLSSLSVSFTSVNHSSVYPSRFFATLMFIFLSHPLTFFYFDGPSLFYPSTFCYFDAPSLNPWTFCYFDEPSFCEGPSAFCYFDEPSHCISATLMNLPSVKPVFCFFDEPSLCEARFS